MYVNIWTKLTYVNARPNRGRTQTETMADPVVLTTDTGLRNYRRLGRKAVPCVTPGQMAGRAAEAGQDGKGKGELDDILKDVTRIFRD